MYELQIISQPIIAENNSYFYAGAQYLNYISFIGCSPYLNFEPQKEIKLLDLKKTVADLNYIQFIFNKSSYIFKKTDFSIKAVCPVCAKIISGWESLISNWEKTSELNSKCPACNQTISLLEVDWKKTAGFIKSAILFHGIQAELATPTGELLIELEKITNIKWQYFYG